MRSTDIYLADILESIDKIETYAKPGKESFLSSTLIQDGIIRNLEIIGEAANQLDVSFRYAHPEIEWKGIISLRNMVIHQYHRVDLNLVWGVLLKDIPVLKEQIQVIIQTHQQ